MANVENLIHSLIQRTKDKKILWEYLAGFPKLKDLSIHVAGAVTRVWKSFFNLRMVMFTVAPFRLRIAR